MNPGTRTDSCYTCRHYSLPSTSATASKTGFSNCIMCYSIVVALKTLQKKTTEKHHQSAIVLWKKHQINTERLDNDRNSKQRTGKANKDYSGIHKTTSEVLLLPLLLPRTCPREDTESDESNNKGNLEIKANGGEEKQTTLIYESEWIQLATENPPAVEFK